MEWFLRLVAIGLAAAATLHVSYQVLVTMIVGGRVLIGGIVIVALTIVFLFFVAMLNAAKAKIRQFLYQIVIRL